MSAARIASSLTISLAISGIVTLGCSSSENPDDRTFAFKDTSGRSCTVKQFPPKASCDRPATKTCGPGTRPCFIVATGQLAGDGGVSGPRVVRNCESCCRDNENSSSTSTVDCVALVCTADTECAGDDAKCTNGQCVVL